MQLHGRSTADADAGTGHVEAERRSSPFTKMVPRASSLVQCHSLSLFLADGVRLAIVFYREQKFWVQALRYDSCQPSSYDTGESLSNQETTVNWRRAHVYPMAHKKCS